MAKKLQWEIQIIHLGNLLMKVSKNKYPHNSTFLSVQKPSHKHPVDRKNAISGGEKKVYLHRWVQ